METFEPFKTASWLPYSSGLSIGLAMWFSLR